MAWSYEPTQLQNSPKDQIRLLIGDTLDSDPLLQDEEIEYYITQCASDVNRAALSCLNVIITRICSTPDYSLGPYSESNGNRLKAFQSVKAELEAKVTGYNAPLAKAPTTGAIFSYDMMSVACCVRGDTDE
jgi:hypothetical protein